MSQFKSGFVTLIGRPNVGKSTLMNHLIGQKIAITSNKPQTTRNKIQTILTEERGQVIFIDTPGIHKPSHKLGEYMVNTAEKTFKEVDVVLFLVEPNDFIGKGDSYILEQLQKIKTPVILIINKIDTVKKEELLTIIAKYQKQYDFKEIIPISALQGENTGQLIDILYNYLPEGPQFFPEDMITDQPERHLVSELIREKTLRLLKDEIPHGIAVVIDQMKKRGERNLIDIDATIICEKDSHKRIIIGKQGTMIKEIGTLAREEIEGLLGSKVNLQLWIKIKKNWRDSDFLLNNFGYDKREQ
ncbi:GTP-binding protein Era [Natranaerovirga hydrolytica]|uniref:GTPase Era n=1 Tax=Natranaerovirga hydrolytica TaxID=680378 RepID=A0A4R1MZK2_9FIRM|nr:GTP-binding protein Era [Natranaerovirga hydrolytica]